MKTGTSSRPSYDTEKLERAFDTGRQGLEATKWLAEITPAIKPEPGNTPDEAHANRIAANKAIKEAQLAKANKIKGAFVRFPTAVMATRARADHGDARVRARIAAANDMHGYPFQLTHEPGLFPVGTTRVEGTVSLPNGVVEFYFDIAVGSKGPDPEHGAKVISGTVASEVITNLPTGVRVPTCTGRTLVMQAERLAKHRERAITDIIKISRGQSEALATKKYEPHLSKVLATRDEVVAGAELELLRYAEQYCSPERASQTWGGRIRKSVDREMSRAAHFYNVEREDDRACRLKMERLGVGATQNDTRTAADVHHQVCAQATADRFRRANPNWSDAQVAAAVAKAAANGKLAEPHSVSQVERIMQAGAATQTSLDGPIRSDSDLTLADTLPAVEPSSLVPVSEMLDVFGAILALHPYSAELPVEAFYKWFAASGLSAGVENAAKPAPLPVEGELARLWRLFFSPFALPGEKWHKAADRNAQQARFYMFLTNNGHLVDAETLEARFAALTARLAETDTVAAATIAEPAPIRRTEDAPVRRAA